MPIEQITPFYFGTADARRFGCCHMPPRVPYKKCACVICPPVGHEYINSHRALRQLAARLAEAGFPVLRFDYFACGDSSGTTSEARLAQWLTDLSEAVAEVRQRTQLSRVCLVGLRLGAALSMLAAARRADIDSIVLWDPVVMGRTYLDELVSLEKQMLRFRPKLRSGPQPSCREILGFQFSRGLWEEFGGLDLTAIETCPLENLLLVETGPAPGADIFRERASRLASSYQHQRIPALQPWLPTPDGSLPVPHQVLQSIVAWVRTTHP